MDPDGLQRCVRSVFVVILCALFTRAAWAEDGAATPPSNKLTMAYYDFSSGTQGYDINLRHTFSTSTAWLGVYNENDGFDQVRAGYEYDYHHNWLTLVPSAQAATHKFVGATVYAEAGRRIYAIGGAGRTNLNPYWNLGFDPNDYVQFGTGYRNDAGDVVSAFAIHDNRLGTGQTNTHLYLRRYLRQWRFTLDVVNEHGTGEGGLVVRAWSTSLDADWRRWFVRVASDPHVNYTADRQVRIAGGVRF